MNLTEASQRGASPSHLRHKFLLSQNVCGRREKHTCGKVSVLLESVTSVACQPCRVGGFVCTLLSSALQCKSSKLLSQRKLLNE